MITIAVRIALTELRHQKWREVSLDKLVEGDAGQSETSRPELLEDSQAGPEITVEKQDLLARIQRIIMEELTEKQRQALIGVGQQGMPLVQQHLEICPDCREEFEALMRILKASPAQNI